MPKVVVIGSINMDIVASTERHPSAGETVPGRDLNYYPGGKGANQAVAAAKAGGTVVMSGAVGAADFFTDRLLSFLKEANVDTTFVVKKPDTATGTALIVVADSGQNDIVVVPGANGKLVEEDFQNVPISKADILVGQYEVPMTTTQAFFELGKSIGTINILNPAPAKETPAELLKAVDILVVNETELAALSGVAVDENSTDDALLNAMSVMNQHGLQGTVIATLGERGLIARVSDQIIRIPGYKVTAVDTTGAGDCFVGCLASELAGGSPIEEALRFANAAAALSVQSVGAGPSMPSRENVENLFGVGA